MIEETVAIRGGWAILSDGWAVFGATKEEAAVIYHMAVKRHAKIMAREIPSEGPHGHDIGVTKTSH